MKKSLFLILLSMFLYSLTVQAVRATSYLQEKSPVKPTKEDGQQQTFSRNKINADDYPFSAHLPIVANMPPDPFESDDVSDAVEISFNQIITGTVSQTDIDDVFKVMLQDGDKLRITLGGTGGDADIYLYPPNVTTVKAPTGHVQFSQNENNSDELIEYDIDQTGFWFVNVFSFEGETSYQLVVTVE